MTCSPSASRIAYLTSQYPALSHTFILREVAALRTRGLAVDTFSVRRTGPDQHVGPAEKAEAESTVSLLPDGLKPVPLIKAQIAGLRRPARYFRALRLALATRAPGVRALAYQLIYFTEATLLARHLQTRDITHLHAHFANACATVGMLAAIMADIPFSFTLHGPSDLAEPRHWRLDEKIARARFVACISHFARSQAMLNSDPAHWPRLRIVHCGIEPDRYVTDPAPAGPLRLIFVGRLAPVKGLRLLVPAFARLRTDHPDALLTVIGDGPDRAWLEAEAARVGGIRVLGAQSQDRVAEELAQSHALVLPSFAEGVPVVLMEAMASARPVIATRVAGVGELVEDGTSGYVVPPGDLDGLVAAMENLAADPALRARMGAAGRRKVEAEFDISLEAFKLCGLLSGR